MANDALVARYDMKPIAAGMARVFDQVTAR